MGSDYANRLPSVATLVGGVLAVGLAILAPPATAQEDDREVILRHPVVVVRGGEHGHGFTWAFAGTRAFLGVQTVALTRELREHFGVPPEAGVLVAKIVDDSPAAAAGLEIGDIISAVDDAPIETSSSLAQALRRQAAGDDVGLEVWRDGRVLSISATLVEREAPAVDIRQFRLPEGGVRQWEWDETELEGAIELEIETFNRAIERLNEELDNPEWHSRIHSFKEHQGTLMKRIEVLEGKLREMEEELRRLEKAD